MAAPELFRIGPLIVSGSTVVTVIVALVLVIAAQLVTRNAQLVPSGFQNFGEWLVESLYNFLGDILGEKLVRNTFWFFATLFIFILSLNWFGLLPGVGTVGYGEGPSWWRLEITDPFLRGANADLNLPAAMSIVFFALWIYWALRDNGPVGVAKHIFGSKAHFNNLTATIAMALIFFAIGGLEVISILIRPLALTLRLYGNIFGGEVLIDSMMRIVPSLSFVIPLPFYFYELLVGLVQALVFCLLCAVFTAMMCRHEDEGHGAGGDRH
jgi:F-type H+-transporting ATPase subunit a